MSLKIILEKNLTYFIPVIIFLLTGILFLLLYDKSELHLMFNALYSPMMDGLFRYGTYLGDGLIYPVVGILLLFVRWRYFLGFMLSGVLVLLITSFLKQVAFEGMPRPVKYFQELEQKIELRLVEGVETARHNSFPSGHTTTAFAALGFLAMLFRSQLVKLLFFAGAFVGGYSRIYLSQHFLADVVAGAFIGTCIAILCYFWCQRLSRSWVDNSLTRKRVTS